MSVLALETSNHTGNVRGRYMMRGYELLQHRKRVYNYEDDSVDNGNAREKD